MSLKFRLTFGAIVLAQVLLLIGVIGQREYSLRHGTEVVLQIRPVDPRSLFQGDYAILAYEISRPPREGQFSNGDSVYVYLEEGPESWRGVDYRHRRDSSDKRPFIKGRMGDHRDIDFGIGTYFVPEGTGYIIEDAADVKVVVSVNYRGHAIIKDVLVDGVPFHEARRQSRSP